MALDRCSLLPLALGCRLFVELAGAKLGQQTGFLDRALEAAECGLKGLVFAYADTGHGIVCLFKTYGRVKPNIIAIGLRRSKVGKLDDSAGTVTIVVSMRVLGFETSCDETGV